MLRDLRLSRLRQVRETARDKISILGVGYVPSRRITLTLFAVSSFLVPLVLLLLHHIMIVAVLHVDVAILLLPIRDTLAKMRWLRRVRSYLLLFLFLHICDILTDSLGLI